MNIRSFLISLISFYLLSSYTMAMDDEQHMEGNYHIKHVSTTLGNSLLTWVSEEQKAAPAGYYAQVINKSNESQESYIEVESWAFANLWSVLPAEDNCYTIKNLTLDYGLLGALPDDQKVQVLDGKRYITSRAHYLPGGDLRNSVLWRIEKDEHSSFYIIRSRMNNGLLSLLDEQTFLGEYVTVLEDHPTQSYLSKGHKMRNSILWNIAKQKIK